MIERESMDFDVVIVGAGPAGLSSAIRLAQLSQQAQLSLTICVVEKGSEVGAHILSGAVFEPRALTELLPDWQNLNAPIGTAVVKDEIHLLTSAEAAKAVPLAVTPYTMHNEGNYITSMGNLCRFLAQQAESLGVEIFPGFSAAELLVEDNVVKGVITGDMGIGKDGEAKDSFVPGMELRAKYTLFAEGCRGHLGKQLQKLYKLADGQSPQHYGIGFKEIWEIPAAQHQPGLVVHTAGWPLKESGSSGGGYLYHAENNQVWLGLIVDLNYDNPHVSPFDEFQRMKHHPLFASVLKGGKRLCYGARAIAKGGLNSLPKFSFPGGMLLGCDAGTLNFSKIKGNHCAMKSGMLAAETVCAALQAGDQGGNDLVDMQQRFKDSWLYQELYQARNFGPALHKFGSMLGGAYNTVEQNLFKGKTPFTLYDNKPDHTQMQLAANTTAINYPKPDGVLSFDKLSSVFLSNTNHEEDQPSHLKLTNPELAISVNYERYLEPAQRYCPAGVYEVVDTDSAPRLQINAQNCVHCKTCDIKDPSQNITWVTPEGAGGPNYPNM